jgi:regulatory protein YycI of two-component signal transduction system YycFG
VRILKWSQAKNILIILFILINTLLLLIIASIISPQKENSQLIQNTLSILNDRNIEVNCVIPDETPKMGNLAIKTPENGFIIQDFLFQNLETFIELGEVKNYSFEYVEDKRVVMNVSQILLKNFTINGEKSSINDIKCGYIQKVSKTKIVDSIFIPVWKVITGDEKKRYYKAFTGEEYIS